jgi:hypothetical protein
MKKFSKISGSKVSEEPKVEIKVNEEDLFKTKVLNLMDQLLSIRTYGPIDRYLRAGNIKISGKEMFLEALMDILKDKSKKDEVKLLESLKSNIKDWEYLDTKIDEAINRIEESESNSKILTHRNKIQYLFDTYGQDEELLMNMIEESCKKITDKEKSHLRALAAEYMANEGKYPKELFNKISEKFKERTQQLENN